MLSMYRTKAKRVAMSNWDAEHLSANQVAYAASDAILGLVAARGIVTKVAAEDLLIEVLKAHAYHDTDVATIKEPKRRQSQEAIEKACASGSERKEEDGI